VPKLQRTDLRFEQSSMSYLTKSQAENALIKLGLSVFSVGEFSKIFSIKPTTARSFLSRNSKKKSSHFLKLKRGIYAFSINLPTKFEIANKIYQPSYISFETALSYYNIIPETVYTITSATTKRSKEFIVQKSVFKYYKIKKKLLFGYQPRKIKNKIILIAEKEKALLDYIYFLSLKKQSFIERLDLSKINTKRLGYLVIFFKKALRKNKAFLGLINKIYKPL
jgi:predicted transcriptional regulator of viral defense system